MISNTAIGHKLYYRKFHLKVRKSFFYCKHDQTLAQVAQRGCGVSILEDIQNLTGRGPEQRAVGDPALSRGMILSLYDFFLEKIQVFVLKGS